MNVVCLMGRLTADPELRHTQSGNAVTGFTLAVDRAYTPKGQEKQTDFINIAAWRQTAEFICRYFQKGQRMALQGRLESRSYTDKNGDKRTVYEVVAEQAYFADSKAAAPAGGTAKRAAAGSWTPGGMDFEEIPTDDQLPF